jgi:hypothetical protein
MKVSLLVVRWTSWFSLRPDLFLNIVDYLGAGFPFNKKHTVRTLRAVVLNFQIDHEVSL